MFDLCLIELPNPALESPKMYMALGNLYLAASALKAGYKTVIADFRESIGEIPKAEFYGFSCTTPQIDTAEQLVKKVRGKTIIGGAHPSLLPEDCMGKFDYIVRGEGEETLIDILKGKYNKNTIINAPRIIDLDTIPYPAWDLVRDCFSTNLYTGERYGLGGKSVAVITSRGCPYRCAFCGNVLLKPVTFRSIDNVWHELLELMKRGVTHFRFVDDNFTLHPQFPELCKKIEMLGVHYRCHTRSNLIDSKKAEMMKGSGCEECSLGVESADDRVLKINHKGETVSQHAKAIRILQEGGLNPKIYWMSGLPGETDETIELNMQFMRELKPTKWTLSTFTPYPGCDIYNNPQDYNIEITNHHWRTWWNFVFCHDKVLPNREGYNHVLLGQTQEEMEARHNKFYRFLREESWE